jgi:hypothetical protein
MSFLLARGARATARDENGWTPLMHQALYGRAACVERLLKESAVVATINTQTTREWIGLSQGYIALHIVCTRTDRAVERSRIIEMLIYAGANPTIEMFTYPRCNLVSSFEPAPEYQAAVKLLDRTIHQTRLNKLLDKAREINDIRHANAKAYQDAQNKILADTPPFLQERVRKQQQQLAQIRDVFLELPRVEVLPPANPNEEEAKKLHATLQYVLHLEEVGETGGMAPDVYEELMEMMTPLWHPIRRNKKGEGGSGDEVREATYWPLWKWGEKKG